MDGWMDGWDGGMMDGVGVNGWSFASVCVIMPHLLHNIMYSSLFYVQYLL